MVPQAWHRAQEITTGKATGQWCTRRMHRTLKQSIGAPRPNEAAQQRALNRFRRVYNEQRPHHALQLKKPASCYANSDRPYPRDLPDPVYPGSLRAASGHEDRRLHMEAAPDLPDGSAAQRDTWLRTCCARAVVGVLWRDHAGAVWRNRLPLHGGDGPLTPTELGRSTKVLPMSPAIQTASGVE